MPLTKVEKNILSNVVHRFLDEKKLTQRRELVLEFEEPEAIDRLFRWQLLQTFDGTNYVPTAISFEYCGDAEVRAMARRSVRAVAHVLKALFREESPSLAAADIENRAREFYDDVDEKTIRLGLYLAPDLRLLSGFQGRNQQQIDVAPVSINEYVVTLKNFDGLWDDYIRQFGVPFERDKSKGDRAQPADSKLATVNDGPLLAIETLATDVPGLRERISAIGTKTEWMPKGWKIVDSLPEGGQGWTYRVMRLGDRDQGMYVLKRLKNPNRLARFQREIEALKKLQHPGILRIIETSQEGTIYIAEYCERGDLAKTDLSGKTLLDRLRLYREICDAVAAAHRANIIHRDLKPQNILIRADSSIAVGDFGLCLDLSDLENRPTSSSEAVGPRHYIAPELEDGRNIDPKPSSDCYSLGKLLYFILSGRSFARERHGDTEYELRKADSDPNLHFVYELLDKTIATFPSDRYQSAVELLAALNGVILKIEQNAHVLNMRVPQHCLYCCSGLYQLRLYTPGKPAGLSDPVVGNDFQFWGNNYMGDKSWMILVCGSCGNVQMFRPDLTGRERWKNLK